MARLSTAGTSFECIERGRGQPVVFVHGSASDHRTWGSQLDAFGSRFRAIAYSRRYHWPNAPIPEDADYGMPQQLDDLEAVLRSLDATPAHLVGHSYGGFLCLLLAHRAPSLVRSLVLEEPPVLPLFVSIPPRPIEMMKLLLRRPRTAVAIAKFGAMGLGPATRAVRRGDVDRAVKLFGRAVLGRRAFQRLSPARLEQVRANFFKAELLGDVFVALEPSAVGEVRAPTLLVTGRRSPRLFHRLTDRLAELLPHAERVDVPDASHIVHEDDAPAYNAAVLAHVERSSRI